MTRNQIASLLGNIIRLARQGKMQSEIARSIRVNPGLVYTLCKLYGIRTKKPVKAEQSLPQMKCSLPMMG